LWTLNEVVRFCSGILSYTDSYKYLGHVINIQNLKMTLI